jgi:hypothetical protein
MSLSYLRDDCHKQAITHIRVAAIRIDVYHAEENPTNTPRTLSTPVHACLTYAFCGQSPYLTIFHWLPQSQNMPLHPEEVLATKDRLVQLSSCVTSFLLPCDSPVVGERGFNPMVTQLHQLTGHISSACDRYVQYLFMGVNRTFPTSCLHFSLVAPPGLQFNQVLITKSKF